MFAVVANEFLRTFHITMILVFGHGTDKMSWVIIIAIIFFCIQIWTGGRLHTLRVQTPTRITQKEAKTR